MRGCADKTCYLHSFCNERKRRVLDSGLNSSIVSLISGLKPAGMFWSALTLDGFYLLDGLQHGPASVPGLGGLLDAVQAGHAVPLPVLQLPVEGVGKHQHAVVQVQVGHLKARHGQDEYT